MEEKIFLEKNRNRFSTNKPNKIWADLYTKTRTLQNSGLMGNFSLFEQYNSERDLCNKYRMIFVVSPICTNALFNMRTEIVRDEGSPNAMVLTDTEKHNPSEISDTIVNTTKINRIQAIRDTEYSHPRNGNFEYHCGVDIFNNHMLRNTGFVHINKIHESCSGLCRPVFNTIEDYVRDSSGRIVKNSASPHSYRKKENERYSNIRLYGHDNCLPFKQSYLNRIKEKDGWIGFYNPSNINIENSENRDVLINAMLSNRKPCEFIDMYPDRTLYSFIPKYNEHRHRIEKNWDYCITYPYAKDYEMVNTVCGGHLEAIRVDFVEGHNSSSVPILMCRTLFKHTLKVNNKINVYYYSGDTFKKHYRSVPVISVGNYDGSDTDRFFSIRINDIADIYESIKEDKFFFYKKVSNGAECEYYFRKYKKIKNGENELKSEVNKLAYAENIYGDRVAQVMFLDDINLDGVYDHLGRPVTEAYFTIIKRNAGHDEWDRGIYSGETIEYSHCFGKVTSGLDFGPFSASQFDYNIHYLHNISINKYSYTTEEMSYLGEVFSKENEGRYEMVAPPKVIEDDITIQNDEFYGDVVEFDAYNFKESEISPVLHRFNTAQRELQKSEFKLIYYDKIVRDVYDIGDASMGDSFLVSGNVKYNKIGNFVVPAVIRPEGYFYNPNTKIRVKEEDDFPIRVRAKYINFSKAEVKDDLTKYVIKITAPSSYGFLKWDYIIFYRGCWLEGDEEQYPNTIFGQITEVSGLDLTIEVKKSDLGRNENFAESLTGDNRYKAYYTTESVPAYARFNKSTQEFVWRGIKAPSEMRRDMELYDIPFANGRFYIEKNITFFLKRQDPYGDFGLSVARFSTETHKTNPMEYFNIDPTMLDLSQIYNFYNNVDNICY